MIDASSVAEIVAQYQKHGWTLRRALLSPEGTIAFGGLLGNIEQLESDFDALWFSRFSKPELESWELRRLTALPFALLTAASNDAPVEEREAALSEIEEEMRERTFA